MFQDEILNLHRDPDSGMSRESLRNHAKGLQNAVFMKEQLITSQLQPSKKVQNGRHASNRWVGGLPLYSFGMGH